MPPPYNGPGIVLGWTENAEPITSVTSVPRVEWEGVRDALTGRLAFRGTVAGVRHALTEAIFHTLNEQVPAAVEWPSDNVIASAVETIMASMRPERIEPEGACCGGFCVSDADAFEVLMGDAIIA